MSVHNGGTDTVLKRKEGTMTDEPAPALEKPSDDLADRTPGQDGKGH